VSAQIGQRKELRDLSSVNTLSTLNTLHVLFFVSSVSVYQKVQQVQKSNQPQLRALFLQQLETRANRNGLRRSNPRVFRPG
jgi:hypothetical protein